VSRAASRSGVTDRVAQAQVDQVQTKHAEQRIEQALDDLRRFAAHPYRREGEDADQVVDAGLEPLDLSGEKLWFHVQRRFPHPS
jgi:hypothetical protein